MRRYFDVCRIKRGILLGLCFPLFSIVFLFGAKGFSENYRVIRHMGVFPPLPLFLVLFFFMLFFLSLAFFSDGESLARACTEDAQNRKISAITSAFLAIIWFFLEFAAFSPLCALLGVISSLMFSIACAFFSMRASIWGGVFALISSVILISFTFMNLKLLFI